ncbi:unnamed protein product [Ixodes hexagonus]
MNHVWAVTFKTPEGKRKALVAGDLVVKGRRCLVIDPCNRDFRVKLHWLLFHVPDDEARVALSPYGKVVEVGTEKWRVQGVMGCGSMTRTAVIRLKPGVSLDDLPHQLKIAGGPALVVVPAEHRSACVANGLAISAVNAVYQKLPAAIGSAMKPTNT